MTPEEIETSYRAYLVAYTCASTGGMACSAKASPILEEAAAALGARDGLRTRACPQDLSTLPMPRKAFMLRLGDLLAGDDLIPRCLAPADAESPPTT